jgi:hypothetical protein
MYEQLSTIEKIEVIIDSTTIFRITAEGIAVLSLLKDLRTAIVASTKGEKV